MVWGPELGLKTAHLTFFTFLFGGGLRSTFRSQDGSFYLFTWGVLSSRIMHQDWLIFHFYLFFRVVWVLALGLKTAHFTFLHRGDLRSTFGSQDGFFTILPIYLGMLWCPESFSFHLFTWGCSEVQIYGSRRLILPFYLFTCGWSEVQNQISRRHVLPFSFLPFYLGVF